MQETWVWSLGWEDPLEKGKAAHSSILAWRIPWTVQSMRSQRVGHNWVTFTFPLTCIEIFLTFSCLAIPTVGGPSLTHQPHQRRILTDECAFPSDFLHLQPFHFIWRRAKGAWTVEIKPVNTKGNQPWIFIGRTDAEAEAPILWAPDAKSWLIGKDPDAGKDWRREEKGTTEDEMVR